jgi:hypothetical protein
VAVLLSNYSEWGQKFTIRNSRGAGSYAAQASQAVVDIRHSFFEINILFEDRFHQNYSATWRIHLLMK